MPFLDADATCECSSAERPHPRSTSLLPVERSDVPNGGGFECLRCGFVWVRVTGGS